METLAVEIAEAIANKDLTNCMCDGVTFIGEFDDASIEGCSFKGSSGAVIDPQTIKNNNFYCTNLCDVEFTREFSKANVMNASFEGSKNAIMFADKIEYNEYTSFVDAIMVGKVKKK